MENPHEQEARMSKVEALTSKLNVTQVGRVCVTVSDTDRAIDFYVDTLGFDKVVDVPMGDAGRWVEVAVPGAVTTIALAPPPPGGEAGGTQTGICLDTSDVDADHATLKAAGVDVDDDVTRWGGPVPPMFWLRDPDGNSLIIVQPRRNRGFGPQAASCRDITEGLRPLLALPVELVLPAHGAPTDRAALERALS
jgi:catechol 2,3-dioxygenase-like lactoylglutathione lyase family enzyme